MKLNCLVIDDVEIFRELTSYLVSQHPKLKLVASCSNADEAITIMANSKIDLIFLDIEMPGTMGIDLVRSAKIVPQVVFVTSHTQYAAEAFEYDVTDYIVKPMTESRFKKAVEKALTVAKYQELVTEDEHLYFRVDSNLVKIKFRDIISIHSLGDYIQVFEKDKKHIVLGTLNNMQNSLNLELLMRVHRKFIIRIDAVKAISDHTVMLEDETEVQVSRTMKTELVDRLQ